MFFICQGKNHATFPITTVFAKLLVLGMVLLVHAKPGEITSLTELNRNDDLFEKQNCLLFLFAMTAMDTKV